MGCLKDRSSPDLFNLYIYIYQIYLQQMQKKYGYADDLTLVVQHKLLEPTQNILTNDFYKCIKYFTKWQQYQIQIKPRSAVFTLIIKNICGIL